MKALGPFGAQELSIAAKNIGVAALEESGASDFSIAGATQCSPTRPSVRGASVQFHRSVFLDGAVLVALVAELPKGKLLTVPVPKGCDCLLEFEPIVEFLRDLLSSCFAASSSPAENHFPSSPSGDQGT